MNLANADPFVVVTCLSTVALTIVTAYYVVITRQILLSQTDPHVIVYPVNPRSSDMTIVVENIGTGIARDIRFRSSAPIPFWQRDKLNPIPLTQPIPSLAPKQRMTFIWGPFGFLKEQLAGREIVVTCKFTRSGSSSLDETLSVECVLAIDHFLYDRFHRDQLEECADALRNIENIMRGSDHSIFDSHLERIASSLELLAVAAKADVAKKSESANDTLTDGKNQPS